MTPAQFIDNPAWAEFLPEAKAPPRPRSLPDHADCSRIDEQEVARHLRKGGSLGLMEGYEERPGQIQMASAVAESINCRRHLMVEAGTGTGKSLGYLVPAVAWALCNDTPVVVSTATRNLQSQLMTNDIPRAVKTLGDKAAGFKVALLKGRANYVCLRAVNEFFAGGYWSMDEEDKRLMPGFIEFLRTTPDGDLDMYEGISREYISCPGEECSSRHCQFYTRCFVYRARKRALEAHIVVANHALVLTEASGPAGILPAFSVLVMDEAHNLESIATDQFSGEFSERALNRILMRLVRRGKRKGFSGGVLSSVGRQLLKGAVVNRSQAESIRRVHTEILASINGVYSAASHLASSGRLVFGNRKTIEPFRYGERDVSRVEIVSALSDFENQVCALVRLVHTLCEYLKEASEEPMSAHLAEFVQQLSNIAQLMVDFANETEFVFSAKNCSTHVYWAERERVDGKRHSVRFVASPLSVAADLRNLIYKANDSVILCSATLRTGGNFKYSVRRLGFEASVEESETYDEEKERYLTLVSPSPFDYFRQCKVLAPDFIPDPAVDAGRYDADFSDMLEKVCVAFGGRTLVLFTSYEMMSAVAGLMRGRLADNAIELLVQGEGLSRESIVARLRNGENRCVAFGTQSFWEGVDVAGSGLSCVVIARLPFAQKGDPIVEARCDMIEKNGGSSFREYILPEAAIRFQQGFGRLIRTKSDRGVVIVADPRLVVKNYGGSFRKSIPATVRPVSDMSELMSCIEEFLLSSEG